MSPSSSTVSPESAVRVYLQYLEDPGSVVDKAMVKRLQGELDKAKDPLDRLRAMAALDRAQSTDDSTYRADFVRYAKQWADEEGIPAAAFRQIGVPDDVLVEAGLDRTPKGRRGAKAGAAPRQRRLPVKTAALEEAVLAMDEPFTVKDICERVGGSTVTIKTVLDRLIAEKKVTDAGERAGPRGRAAKLWKVA